MLDVFDSLLLFRYYEKENDLTVQRLIGVSCKYIYKFEGNLHFFLCYFKIDIKVRVCANEYLIDKKKCEERNEVINH
jgi:hypothetical protein